MGRFKVVNILRNINSNLVYNFHERNRSKIYLIFDNLLTYFLKFRKHIGRLHLHLFIIWGHKRLNGHPIPIPLQKILMFYARERDTIKVHF